jgi:hypothetical protein
MCLIDSVRSAKIGFNRLVKQVSERNSEWNGFLIRPV